MRILITGANGFVGRALCFESVVRGIDVVGIARASESLTNATESICVANIDGSTDWQAALAGCEVVVHLAARVHVMQDLPNDSLDKFRQVNVNGTLNLARQSAALGVRRFIFISSIKVNGEATELDCPFSAEDIPAPQDAYGISKMEAEQGLRELAVQSSMEIVIIRPPLVYGPGVKANFATMMRCLKHGIPLPLGAIDNRRSFVALDNLVDLILTCLDHPAAVGQVFLVSDGQDVSTTELLRRMGNSLGCPARLISVPPWLLKFGAVVLGKQGVERRLCGSLQVDIEKTRRLLGWTPPLTLEQGLIKAAEGEWV